MAKKLKVGIIGLGGIANTHVPGWASSPYSEVVAGGDINPDVFPVWQQKHGVIRFCQDPMDLMSHPKPVAVSGVARTARRITPGRSAVGVVPPSRRTWMLKTLPPLLCALKTELP